MNNLTINNKYLLPLIGVWLDKVERAKQFMHLELTNIYYQMRIREWDKLNTMFKT